MKKQKKMISIILSLFILNFIMILPVTNASSVIENIITEYSLKEKAQNFLYETGRRIMNDFSNSFKAKQASGKVQQNLQGKSIVIDAGHGGHNPGAVRYNLREADNNLAVANKLQQLLQSQGAEVIMTRTADVSMVHETRPLKDELQARVDITQRNNADIFISIHTNSNENSNIHGAMTFYYDDASKSLAKVVQANMINTTNAVDKGIAVGDFLVLRNNKVPAILVEMGFISNQTEALKLNEDGYRNQIAQGLAQGIINYFKNT